MRNPFCPDPLAERALIMVAGLQRRLEAQAEAMKLLKIDMDKRFEELRIRLSGPEEKKPKEYKPSQWLQQRQDLEAQHAQKDE